LPRHPADWRSAARAGLDQEIRLWDTTTFDPVARLTGHSDDVASLAWDPSGERLISSSGDNTVRIWETAPVRTRLAARAERRESLARVAPIVAQLFTEHAEPEQVFAALTSAPDLDEFERKVARQITLRIALERAPLK